MVARAALLLTLGLAGCKPHGVLDFFLSEERVQVFPGGPSATVAVEVQADGDRDSCRWVAEGVPEAVTLRLPEAFTTCDDFSFDVNASATASPDVVDVYVVGTLTNERRRRLVIEISPTVGVDIVSPADGLATPESSVDLAAEVTDPLHPVQEIAWRWNGGPWQLFCSGACNPSTPGGKTYTADALVTLQAGANRLTVRAENVLGHVAEETVTVTYQPVTAGTARWDGEAGDGLWTTGLNWDSDTVPGPGDDVVIDDGSAVRFDVVDPAEVRSLSLDAGALTIERGELHLREASDAQGSLVLAPGPGAGGGATLSVGATLDVWGSIECSGTGRLGGGAVRVGFGAQARFEACILSGAGVANAGEATVVGALALATNASLENESGGSLALQDASIVCEGTGCTGAVANAGAMDIHGFFGSIGLPLENSGAIGIEATSVDFVSGANTGSITSATASLSLDGDWTMESGSSVATPSLFVSPDRTVVVRGGWDVDELQIQTGAEVRLTASSTPAAATEVTVSGGSLVLGTDVELEAGEVTLTSGRIEVGDDGVLYARSRLRWSSGVLAGAGSTRVISRLATDPPAILQWDGSAGRSLDGHRLLVVGETFWSGGDVLAGNGAEFNHSGSGTTGLVRVQGDDAFRGDALGGDIAVWLNQGVIRKESGTGETLIDGCYQVASGGAVVENSGSVRIEVRCSP